MNINQVYAVLNKAIKQTWGTEALTIIDERSLISVGRDTIRVGSSESKKLFATYLTDIITDTIYVSRPLNLNNLGLSRDMNGFNGIKRKIRVKPILTNHNTEFDLNNDAEFKPFDVIDPDVMEMIFNKAETYAVDIFIPDNQLFQAFESNADMEAFYSLLFKQLDDAITRAENAFDRLALANFIGEKIKLQTTQGTKLHAINILKVYNDRFGTQLEAANVYNDKEFLRFFSAIMLKYKRLIAEDTDKFNASEGYPMQTPEEYLNVYILAEIDDFINAYLYSDTYHDEMVRVSNYKAVASWQGIGDNADPFGVSNTSKIHVNIASDGTEIEQDGILAVMVDRDAVATYYDRPMAESWRVYTKGTRYHKNGVKSMINDMYENGLVLYVKDED